jgi:hypothetical protein
MKFVTRDPLFVEIHKGLLKAYQHIPAELEAERKRKEALALAEKLAVKVH